MMEDDMLLHSSIGSCCSRPRFNFVGGVDDGTRACSHTKPWTARMRGFRNMVVYAMLTCARKIGRVFVSRSTTRANKD